MSASPYATSGMAGVAAAVATGRARTDLPNNNNPIPPGGQR